MISVELPEVKAAELNAEIALYVKHGVIEKEAVKGLRKNADKVAFITNLYKEHGVILEVTKEALKDHKDLIDAFVKANNEVDGVEEGEVLLIDTVDVENYLGLIDPNTPEPPQAPEVKKEGCEAEELVYQGKTVVSTENRILSGKLYKLVKIADGTEYTITPQEFEDEVNPRA